MQKKNGRRKKNNTKRKEIKNEVHSENGCECVEREWARELRMKSKNSLRTLNDNLHEINGVKRKIHKVFIRCVHRNIAARCPVHSRADQH